MISDTPKSVNSNTTVIAHGIECHRAKGRTLSPFFEFPVHRPITDQRIVDRVPDRADRQDRAGPEHIDFNDIGQEKQIVEIF